MGNLVRKRGRPNIDGSMHCQYRLRMDDDMYARLGALSKLTGKSRADIFREAFNLYDNLKRAQQSDDD